jgi:hypothetical protein
MRSVWILVHVWRRIHISKRLCRTSIGGRGFINARRSIGRWRLSSRGALTRGRYGYLVNCDIVHSFVYIL